MTLSTPRKGGCGEGREKHPEGIAHQDPITLGRGTDDEHFVAVVLGEAGRGVHYGERVTSSLSCSCARVAYRLSTVVPRLLTFIDDLTNWYVRFNRKRLKARKLPPPPSFA